MSELQDHASRSHALLSASSAARWIACPPSAMIADTYPRRDTDYTKEGTIAHEVAEAIASGRVDPTAVDLADGVTREMLDCATGYRDYIAEHRGSEADTVLLEQRVDYSDWAPGGFGTADCIIVGDRRLCVIDYKFGKGVAVDAKANPQLRLYALGAYALLSPLMDIDTVEMHIYQPRIGNISTDMISVEVLLDWAEGRVRPAAAEASLGTGHLRAGSHCGFCPHSGHCAELTRVCADFAQRYLDRQGRLSGSEIAEVLGMEPMIAKWLRAVKAQALEDCLGGSEIPGYKVVEGRQGNREWSDETAVAEVLMGAGFREETICTLSVKSPAQMEKAIGQDQMERVEAYITRSPGALTLVPEGDKRPAYDRKKEATNDYA